MKKFAKASVSIETASNRQYTSQKRFKNLLQYFTCNSFLVKRDPIPPSSLVLAPWLPWSVFIGVLRNSSVVTWKFDVGPSSFSSRALLTFLAHFSRFAPLPSLGTVTGSSVSAHIHATSFPGLLISVHRIIPFQMVLRGQRL